MVNPKQKMALLERGVRGRYKQPCLNTLQEKALEQAPGVVRRNNNLSELSGEERKQRDDTEGKKPKIDFAYFTILPGASFDLFLSHSTCP